MIDQLTKLGAQKLDLVVINPGVSFGLAGQHNTLLIVLSVIFILFIFKIKSEIPKFAFWLIIGGSISNLIDRFLYDGVRDWIYFDKIGMSNNLADFAIFISVIIFLFCILKKGKHET